MSDKKQKYPSNLGATRQIDAQNYLAEFILIRHAEAKSIKLPNRIWDKKYSKMLQWKYWYGLYTAERSRAIKLLKDFETKDIISALNNNEGKVILSFSNDKVRRLVKDAKIKRELAEEVRDKNELTVVTPNTLPRRQLGKKSKLGKLR